jgi:hypothetical protein
MNGVEHAPAGASNIRAPCTGSFVGTIIVRSYLATTSIANGTGETGSVSRIKRSLATLFLFTGETPRRCRGERIESDP